MQKNNQYSTPALNDKLYLHFKVSSPRPVVIVAVVAALLGHEAACEGTQDVTGQQDPVDKFWALYTVSGRFRPLSCPSIEFSTILPTHLMPGAVQLWSNSTNAETDAHERVAGVLCLQGFEEIQNLEEYTGLRALFIEGNGLDSLKGLSAVRASDAFALLCAPCHRPYASPLQTHTAARFSVSRGPGDSSTSDRARRLEFESRHLSYHDPFLFHTRSRRRSFAASSLSRTASARSQTWCGCPPP